MATVLPLVACSRAQPLQPKQKKVVSAQDANHRLLFVGNSHSYYHDLPQLVASLIEFGRPSKKVYVESLRVSFLEDVAAPRFNEKLKSVEWDAVILQAQKISSSGKYLYSTTEGVQFAREAKEAGCAVYFFAEWGLQGDRDNAMQTHEIYRTMAQESNATLIPVGQVWQRALENSPDLPLYSSDGNHQLRLGASLTALTIAGYLSRTSPKQYAVYQDSAATPTQWKTFCDAAADVFESSFASTTPK